MKIQDTFGRNSARLGQALLALLVVLTLLVAAPPNAHAQVPAAGTVVAWGDSSHGQLNVPASLTGVTAIAAGYVHSLALKGDGTVVAWGFNSTGQTKVPAGLDNVTAIAAGDEHSLALKSDGTVVTWGDNSHGLANMPAGQRDRYRRWRHGQLGAQARRHRGRLGR